MISLETEQRLAELLHTIAKGQLQVQLCRHSLASQISFEPFSVFKSLDKLAIGSLSSSDIRQFLDLNRTYCSQSQSTMVIRQYDANSDGRLSLNEFIQLVLPSTHQELRNIASTRQPNLGLSAQTEYYLTSLLSKEVNLQREIQSLKKILSARFDFNLLECFRRIDTQSSGYIGKDTFVIFLRKNGYQADENDADALLRRIDSDGDNLISYSEFVQGILPNEGLPRRTYIQTSSPARRSPLRSSPRRSQAVFQSPEQSYGSPGRRTSPLIQSPARNTASFRTSPPRNRSPLRSSPERSVNFRAQSPPRMAYRTSPLRQSPSRAFSSSLFTQSFNDQATVHRSPLRNSPPHRTSYRSPSPARSSSFFNPTRSHDISGEMRLSDLSPAKQSASISRYPLVSSISPSEQAELVSMLVQQIRISREIEKACIDLSLQGEFNLFDAFRMFDSKDRGSVSSLEIEETLQYFGVRVVRDEVYLLIRHYSQLQDAKLRYTDFSEMLLPQEPDYCRLLKNRPALNIPNPIRKDIFKPSTLQLFLDTLRLIIQSEVTAQTLRQRLSRRTYFNLHQAFLHLDTYKDGFITPDEFERVLASHRVGFSRKDVESLMARYDRNRDGKVSYSEFIQEITPKSPRKYQLRNKTTQIGVVQLVCAFGFHHFAESF